MVSGNETTPADGSTVAAAQSKRRADALLLQREIADILSQAKDYEIQGNFEDALKDYEQALRLDPSNPALKRKIRRLRDQIAKENDLIH